MLVLLQRQARPDAPYWPGQRLLSAIDAVAWPVLMVIALLNAPWPTEFVGSVAISLCAIAIVPRLHRAIWLNEWYAFTTWRWGRPTLTLMLFGMILKASI
ncbi:hypothetical protein [Aquabacterium sp. J223]|uniref:hypothetical protein n=1 Tax=Aquabacterium sp. J223 TaxID=2898431 RepID=UPI0021AD64BB|nr:hypothetical protein [Aquabacterium sp. J223]UUX96628.1 hypothetical protein LRS07_04845 [Aquabacterium sp. J223]